MIARKFWIEKIRQLLGRRSVLWISGARRVGKTFLCQSLPRVEYLDCELPRVRRSVSDPESFLRDLEGKLVVLDEIHRLDNPSELLKIAADHYPGVRVIATGSSTLGASTRFRDTLAGRKLELWLTPMLTKDLEDFGIIDLPRRLLRGGLPPFFLADALPEREFQEWIDSFWAKDIQELFRLERKQSFQKFVELLMSQSGGIFEASSFAAPCGVSRTTIANYLAVLEAISSTLAAGGCGVLRLSPAGVSFTSGLKVPTSFVRREDSWLFAETIGTLETLTIVGGGHVALALSRVMAALPLRIVVLDDRPELSTMLENQWAHETRVIAYDDVVEHVPDGDLSYVVIMTHEHANDEAVLGRLATRPYRYLGMMGSPAKVRQLFSNLVAAGLPAESLEQVHSPIGIPIHSHTPEEIAISIAAEIVKVRNSAE